jgi:hypothetical protein
MGSRLRDAAHTAEIDLGVLKDLLLPTQCDPMGCRHAVHRNVRNLPRGFSEIYYTGACKIAGGSRSMAFVAGALSNVILINMALYALIV